jgi:5'-methylthioadenosine phosphorylase
MLGVIGGTVFFEEDFASFSPQQINTKYGIALVLVRENLAFIPRHGRNNHVPPHRVNYRANISALHILGVKKVVGVNSVGSLKLTIKPGSVLVPHDYVSFWHNITFFDDEVRCITPGLSTDMRRELLSALRKVGLKPLTKGVYVQTQGPRLETPAEIKVLAKMGDVVGMTMANEATLAKELEMEYASVCSVDNYANGITKKPLSEAQIKKNAAKNAKKIMRAIELLAKNS